MSDAQQRQVQSTFKALAADATPHQPPVASETPRWTDVPAAVYDACLETEMAIARTTLTVASYEFDLRTVEGYDGRLVVTRTNDERVYEATATIGTTRLHPHRAAELLEQLEKQMQAYARKRRFATADD